MNDPTQLPKDQVELYLGELRRELAGLPTDEVEEILRELRGHIAERVAETDSDRSGTSVEQILRELGSADHIGSLYRADAQLAHARATYSPSLIIGAMTRWATKTVVGFSACVAGIVGYVLGVALIGCAILKPLLPTYIGLWITPSGTRFGFAMPKPQGPELLGWWFIPIGLVVGTACVVGTTAFLRWMLRLVPRTSGRVASAA